MHVGLWYPVVGRQAWPCTYRSSVGVGAVVIPVVVPVAGHVWWQDASRVALSEVVEKTDCLPTAPRIIQSFA